MKPPEQERITTEMLIWAYSHGVFPMADSRQGEVRWYSADPRAVLPLDDFRASKSLMRRYRSGRFDLRFDTAFEHVMCGCARPRRYDGDTWINDQIIESFVDLHEAGRAHSVEAWWKPDETQNESATQNSGKAEQQNMSDARRGDDARDGNRSGDGRAAGRSPLRRVRPGDDAPVVRDAEGYRLVGGLYGVSLGGAFFGESMFSRMADASKVCLVHLVEHLKRRGYVLLDVQMNSAHMAQFGTIDIPREQYMQQLDAALPLDVTWD